MAASRSEVARVVAVDLTGYLQGAGWMLQERTDRFTVWSRQRQDDRFQIVLPLDRNAGDYAERAFDAIRVLAYVDRKSITEMLADVEAGGADVVSVRLDTSAPSGQAPLTVANAAVAALKDLVIGAAAAVDVAAAVLPTRRPRAERYASRVRLSTSPGSFILTVAMPLYEASAGPAGEMGQAAMDEIVEIPAHPFGREVADRMRSVAQAAVLLAVQVNEGAGDLTEFEADPAATGNATELAALAQLGGGTTGDYRMRFAQSPLVARSADVPAALTVGEVERGILAEAAELLRAQRELEDVTVAGTVVGLSRETDPAPGDVVIKGIAAGGVTAHRYRLQLSGDNYHQAVMAHDRGLLVSARGSLVVRGNFLRIEGLRSFTVQQELPRSTS